MSRIIETSANVLILIATTTGKRRLSGSYLVGGVMVNDATNFHRLTLLSALA